METFDTPGTPVKRGLITQLESTPASIVDSLFGSIPIIMIRLDDDIGLIIVGGCDTCGNACACMSRSCTICRAW